MKTRKAFIVFGLLVMSGCASLRNVDRSRLNQPAMDLVKPLTPGPSALLAPLGSLQKSSAGAACAVCAH